MLLHLDAGPLVLARLNAHTLCRLGCVNQVLRSTCSEQRLWARLYSKMWGISLGTDALAQRTSCPDTTSHAKEAYRRRFVAVRDSAEEVEPSNPHKLSNLPADPTLWPSEEYTFTLQISCPVGAAPKPSKRRRHGGLAALQTHGQYIAHSLALEKWRENRQSVFDACCKVTLPVGTDLEPNEQSSQYCLPNAILPVDYYVHAQEFQDTDLTPI